MNTVKSNKLIINIKTNNSYTKIEDVIKNIRENWKNEKSERKLGDIISLNLCINLLTHKYEWEICTLNATENGDFPIQWYSFK